MYCFLTLFSFQWPFPLFILSFPVTSVFSCSSLSRLAAQQRFRPVLCAEMKVRCLVFFIMSSLLWPGAEKIFRSEGNNLGSPALRVSKWHFCIREICGVQPGASHFFSRCAVNKDHMTVCVPTEKLRKTNSPWADEGMRIEEEKCCKKDKANPEKNIVLVPGNGFD